MKKKIIYINARFLSQSITGVQRYAIEVVKALDELYENGVINKDKIAIRLIGPKDVTMNFNLKHIDVKLVGFLKGHLWEQVELPLYTYNGFLLNLCNTAPILKKHQTITIHDAAVASMPEAYTFMFKTWYRLLYKILGHSLNNIFTVSHFSKRELIKYFNIKEKKLKVVYEGKEHILSIDSKNEILKKFDLKTDNFILAVSSLNPNKNFESIVQAIEKIEETNIDIVIAGGTDPKVFNAKKHEFSEKVKYVGYISDSELKALYENASCFVFPSFYEGFGLPPLEAMSCGCPVIVSNTASLPEVCGDSALYCNPYDSDSIKTSILQVINNEKTRVKLKKDGLKTADKFSWEKCAKEIINTIKKLL